MSNESTLSDRLLHKDDTHSANALKRIGQVAATVTVAGLLANCAGGGGREALSNEGLPLSPETIAALQSDMKGFMLDTLESFPKADPDGLTIENNGYYLVQDHDLSLSAMTTEGTKGSEVVFSVSYPGNSDVEESLYVTVNNPSDKYVNGVLSGESLRELATDPTSTFTEFSAVLDTISVGGEEGIIQASYKFENGKVVYSDTSMGHRMDAPSDEESVRDSIEQLVSEARKIVESQKRAEDTKVN